MLHAWKHASIPEQRRLLAERPVQQLACGDEPGSNGSRVRSTSWIAVLAATIAALSCRLCLSAPLQRNSNQHGTGQPSLPAICAGAYQWAR